MSKKTSAVAVMGLFTAIAIIFGYVESQIPVLFSVPGIKLGLANLSVLYILMRFRFRDACAVSAIRIVVVGFMFGNAFSILYSLAGASLSLVVMALLLRFTKASVYGVSMAGGITHNLAQLIVASLIVENAKVFYYLPVLVISGIVTGLLIGFLTGETLKRVRFIPNNDLHDSK